MKPHYVDQGTAAWWDLRLGRPTASQFHRIITPKEAKYSAQSTGYKMQLLAERLLKQPMGDDFLAEFAELGKVEQVQARRQFQLINGVELKPIGFVTTDDGRLGCSPDALFADRPQAVEIKCPKPPKQLEYRYGTEWQVNYRPQVQGQLLIGEWESVHLYVYHPRLEAMHIETKADGDKKFRDALVSHLHRFSDELDALEERARAEGVLVDANRRVIVPDAPDRDAVTILDAG